MHQNSFQQKLMLKKSVMLLVNKVKLFRRFVLNVTVKLMLKKTVQFTLQLLILTTGA